MFLSRKLEVHLGPDTAGKNSLGAATGSFSPFLLSNAQTLLIQNSKCVRDYTAGQLQLACYEGLDHGESPYVYVPDYVLKSPLTQNLIECNTVFSPKTVPIVW